MVYPELVFNAVLRSEKAQTASWCFYGGGSVFLTQYKAKYSVFSEGLLLTT